MYSTQHLLLVPIALLLSACGGGGSSAGIAPRILVSSPTVPPGATSAALELRLEATGVSPALVQLDLVTDAGRLRFDGTAEARQPIDQVAAHIIEPGRLRIVFGDASRANASLLLLGPLLSVPFTVVPGGGSGPVTVRIESLIASTADGSNLSFDAASSTGTVTVQ